MNCEFEGLGLDSCHRFKLCPAALSVSISHSFEAGIILLTQFPGLKNIINSPLSPELNLFLCITNRTMIFSDIIFGLSKPA